MCGPASAVHVAGRRGGGAMGRRVGLVLGRQALLRRKNNTTHRSMGYGKVILLVWSMALRVCLFDLIVCERCGAQKVVMRRGGAGPDQELHGSTCSLCILLQECIAPSL